jgi:coenzyme F420-reducing hydrogenase beta subunit
MIKASNMPNLVSPEEIIAADLCIGCGVCVAQAEDKQSFMSFDQYAQFKPHGDASFLKTSSATFSSTCPFSPSSCNEDELAKQLFTPKANHDAALGRFVKTYVGSVNEGDFRNQGSSGGLVSWIATELLRRKMVDGVAHVVGVNDPSTGAPLFEYRISTTVEEVLQGAKSKYYPVEMSSMLRHIQARPGRYVIIGIPCFIKAIQLLRNENPTYKERISYTLGLFCGHMKSARMIESFAWQMKTDSSQIKQAEFRKKEPARKASIYTASLMLKDGRRVTKDWHNFVDGDWGAGFFMNPACNFCDDVVSETADASFGDAWVEPYASDGRGTSVAILRSNVIAEIVDHGIRQGMLSVQPVGPALVKATQAAGLRQRREGLAYRLAILPPGIKLQKRVLPALDIPASRRLTYRLRYYISKWSHSMFRFAAQSNYPAIYVIWAKCASAVYRKLHYHRVRIGIMWTGINALILAFIINLSCFFVMKLWAADWSIGQRITLFNMMWATLAFPAILLLIVSVVAKPFIRSYDFNRWFYFIGMMPLTICGVMVENPYQTLPQALGYLISIGLLAYYLLREQRCYQNQRT